MDYRASKAWQYSHELAVEVHKLVSEVVESDKVAVALAVRMRRASATAPLQLKASVEKELHREKLACYLASRQALEELHRYLEHALKLNYIEKKFFKKLERLAIDAYRELGKLVEASEKAIATAETE